MTFFAGAVIMDFVKTVYFAVNGKVFRYGTGSI